MPQEAFELRQISPDDRVSGLSLGDAEYAPLKLYLRRHAKAYHAQNAAKTYVFAGTNSCIVGYITLVCSKIEIGAPDDIDDYRHPDFPAIKIARLAVDKRFRGNDLGTQLVDWAIAIATKIIMPNVGCRFLAVDAKKSSIPFYERCGFRLLDTDDNKNEDHPLMFMDIGKL